MSELAFDTRRVTSRLKAAGIIVGANQDENAAAKACSSCADNAACEGFFGMLKRERANRRR